MQGHCTLFAVQLHWAPYASHAGSVNASLPGFHLCRHAGSAVPLAKTGERKTGLIVTGVSWVIVAGMCVLNVMKISGLIVTLGSGHVLVG